MAELLRDENNFQFEMMPLLYGLCEPVNANISEAQSFISRGELSQCLVTDDWKFLQNFQTLSIVNL